MSTTSLPEGEKVIDLTHAAITLGYSREKTLRLVTTRMIRAAKREGRWLLSLPDVLRIAAERAEVESVEVASTAGAAR